MSDETQLDDAILENALGPAEARDDAGSMRQHDLRSQIALAEHLAKQGAAASRRLPIRMGRIRPGGSI